MNFSCNMILRVDFGNLIFVSFRLSGHFYELILANFKVDFQS